MSGIRIYEAERKQYIKLGDLDHMLRGMRHEIYDLYERDENGSYKNMTRDDMIRLHTLTQVMSRIMHNKIHACENAEEIRHVWGRLQDEFYNDKYVLTVKERVADEDGGDEKERLLLFSGYCKEEERRRLEKEGRTDEEIEDALDEVVGTPTFSEYVRNADCFEDYGTAASNATYINHNYHLNAEVKPAWYYNPNVKKRLEAWLGEEEETKE